MSTPVTTYAEIRDKQVQIIENLGPEALTRDVFRAHLSDADFEDWVAEHNNAALRRFETFSATDGEPPELVNYQIVLERTLITHRFAYPHLFATYGAKSWRDIETVIESDRARIVDALRDCNNYTDGQHEASHTYSIDRADAVTFLTIESLVTYYRSHN